MIDNITNNNLSYSSSLPYFEKEIHQVCQTEEPAHVASVYVPFAYIYKSAYYNSSLALCLRSTITAALGAGYREAAKAFEEEAARPRPISAVSVMMSTRPPSRVVAKDDEEELDGTTPP